MSHYDRLPSRHRSTAICRSTDDGNALVRRPWNRVRHNSRANVDLNELMLCVTTIGMQRRLASRPQKLVVARGLVFPALAKA